MTGIEDSNYPEFNRIAAILREAGYEVVNPAELEPVESADWHGYMRSGLSEMLECDAVAVHGSVEQVCSSEGAIDEIHNANRYKIPVRFWKEYLWEN